jgi:tetratricopeptide (TPR) repeat protein
MNRSSVLSHAFLVTARGSDLASSRIRFGVVLGEAGRLQESDRQLTEAVSVLDLNRKEGVTLGYALDALSDVARRRGQLARAIDLGRRALVVQERAEGESLSAIALTRVHTGAALVAHGEVDEGERLLRASVACLESTFSHGHFDLATARFLLGEALLRRGRVAEARPLLKRALQWRLRHLGAADPRTEAVRNALTGRLTSKPARPDTHIKFGNGGGPAGEKDGLPL